MTTKKQRGSRLRVRLWLKIMTGYVIVTALLAAFAVAANTYVSDLKANTETMETDNLRIITMSHEMETAIQNMAAGHRGFLLSGDDLYLAAYHGGNDEVGRLIKEIMTARQEHADQKKRLSQIVNEVASWRAVANQQIQDRRNAGNVGEYLAQVNLDKTTMAMDKVNQVMKDLRQTEADLMTAKVQQAHDLLGILNIGTLALPVVTGLAGVIVVGTVVRSISGRIRQVELAAERIAAGDLTGAELKVSGTDEAATLAQAFNTLKANLRWLISETRESALATKQAADYFTEASSEASDASAQIAEAMGVLSSGAQEQARNVQQAGRVMEELSRAVAQIASGAQQQANAMGGVSDQSRQMLTAIDSVTEQAQAVLEASHKGAELADAGARAVESTVAGMEQIRRTNQEASAKVTELGVRSGEIGTLVADIQAIASQTNLLALNAAIEAARAGEAGRGFAVVAEQVRKLAEDSRVAAQQINQLALAIRQETAEVVTAIAEGEAQAEEGVRLAHDAAGSLEQILLAVRGTTEAAASIAGAAGQLRSQSDVVNAGIVSVAAVTQENTAATEEMAAGAESAIESLGTVANLSSDSAASAEEVSASAEQLTANSQEVARAARGLVDTATRLTDALNKFRV